MTNAVLRTQFARLRTLIKSDAMVYLLGSVVGKAGSIILIPLYTRRLSEAEYGAYALVSSLLVILPILMSWGLSAAITRAYFNAPTQAEGRERMGSVGKGMSALVAVMSMLFLSIAMFVPSQWSSLTNYQLSLVVAVAGFACVGTIADSALRIEQRPKAVVALNLAQFVVTTSLGLTLVSALGRGLNGILEAALAAAMVSASISMFIVFRRFGGTDVYRTTRSAMGFALPFIPHAIANWAGETGDRWILREHGTDLARYYLAIQLFLPVVMTTAAWAYSESPRMGETYRSSGVLGLAATLPGHYRRFAMVAVGAIGLYALGSPVLLLVVGERYAPALWLIPWLALSHFFDALYAPPANLIFHAGYSRVNALSTIVSAGAGLVLCWFLLGRFGLPGLLAARIVSSVLRAGLLAAIVIFIVRATRQRATAPKTDV